jgi:hypothetical protein
MILRTAVALALLAVLPALSAAQEPVADPPTRTHVVQSGETLASIARTYLGTTEAWRQIYEANRDLLDDPHRILPGMELTIPGVGAPTRAAADPGVEVIRGRPDVEVTGVEVGPDPLTPRAGDTLPQVVSGAEQRRQLLRTRPFQPSEVTGFDGPRTVFWGSLQGPARSATRPGVHVVDASESLAVSPSAFHAAAWLAGPGEVPEAVGRITAFAGDRAAGVERTTLQPFDLVQVRLDDREGLGEGDRLIAYHEVGELPGDHRILAPSALLEIRALEPGGALARVLNEFDRAELGHRVIRPRTFPLSPGVHPTTTDSEIEGTVLGFRDRKEIYLPGDQAFIDLGANDGLAVGDEFIGVLTAEGEWSRQRIARFQVISTRSRTATVRLLDSESPTAVRTGLTVVLDRTMP